MHAATPSPPSWCCRLSVITIGNLEHEGSGNKICWPTNCPLSFWGSCNWRMLISAFGVVLRINDGKKGEGKMEEWNEEGSKRTEANNRKRYKGWRMQPGLKFEMMKGRCEQLGVSKSSEKNSRILLVRKAASNNRHFLTQILRPWSWPVQVRRHRVLRQLHEEQSMRTWYERYNIGLFWLALELSMSMGSDRQVVLNLRQTSMTIRHCRFSNVHLR